MMMGHSVDMCSVARPVRSGVSRPGRHEVLAGTTQTAHTTSTNNFVVRTYRVFTAPNVVENKRNLSILKTNKNVLQKIPSSPRPVTPETRRMSQYSVKLDRVSNRNIHIYTLFTFYCKGNRSGLPVDRIMIGRHLCGIINFSV